MSLASRGLLIALAVLGSPLSTLSLGTFSQVAASEPVVEGVSSREVRLQAARSIPVGRLNPQARGLISNVIDNPSFFRRMPSQQIQCDPQMFHFLVRRPEVMVNIWDLLGMTKVSARRTNDFTFTANDGVGTACKCDLVYANNDIYIYYGTGIYDGTMTPRQVTGRCVCVLHTRGGGNADDPIIAGTMDVFLKLDNFGADMLARTLGPFVGKTADYNFAETAKFISQLSQICSHSPAAAQGLAMQLTKVDEDARREFAAIAARISIAAAQAQQADGNDFPLQITATPGAAAPDLKERIQPTSGGTVKGSVPPPKLSWLERQPAIPVVEHTANALQLRPSNQVGSSRTVHGLRSQEPAANADAGPATSGNTAKPAPVVAPDTPPSVPPVRPTKPSIYMRR